MSDWTVDPATGCSNSSEAFREACDLVEGLIRSDAQSLISGRADMTAGLVVAQLAHVLCFGPLPE